MASEYPGRPKLLKGALAVYLTQTPGEQPDQLILFQYNPDQVRRTLARRTVPSEPGAGAGAAREDVLRAPGPPVETLNLTVSLDATDQLAAPDEHETVVEHGLHPALAALEMMLYPPASRVRENEQLAEQGEVQVTPEELPLVLLLWGRSRVVPVMLTNFSVTEEAFDQSLNPIRAKVELGLRVLTYVELESGSLGRDAYFAYQSNKEQQAGRYEPGTEDKRTRALLPE